MAFISMPLSINLWTSALLNSLALASHFSQQSSERLHTLLPSLTPGTDKIGRVLISHLQLSWSGGSANKTVGGEWFTNDTSARYFNNSVFACSLEDYPNSGHLDNKLNLFTLVFGKIGPADGAISLKI